MYKKSTGIVSLNGTLSKMTETSVKTMMKIKEPSDQSSTHLGNTITSVSFHSSLT
ncbi:hypothetical protein [Lactiplantibacillus pingfangensis]|uniref:hypothetical protein n=1 Tax=Lactiplantibacillus pingfangensis TaxID=2559915 RepID=UPI001485A3D5|nr:hypothetical protein [Lactiplantibacillus pingfangensis]